MFYVHKTLKLGRHTIYIIINIIQWEQNLYNMDNISRKYFVTNRL